MAGYHERQTRWQPRDSVRDKTIAHGFEVLLAVLGLTLVSSMIAAWLI